MKLSTVSTVILKNIKAWTLKSLGLSHKIVPYKLLLQTTNDCNSRCESCFIWKINKDDPEKKAQELQLSDFENIFKDMGSHLVWLALSGGEVTMTEDTKEIVRLGKKYCPNLKFVTFTTNGLLPKKALELTQVIKDLELDCFVTISLDGNKEVHDKLRGIKGNFEKVMETERLIKGIGINSHFGITLSGENHSFIINEYKDYQETLKSVTFVHSEGIYNKSQKVDDQRIIESLKHIYRNYKLSTMADIVEKIYIKLGIKFLEDGRKSNIIKCDAGSSSLHIFPRGEVSPCMFLPSSGNVKEKGLKNILDSDAFLEHKKNAKDGQCSKCWMNCYAPHSIMQSPVQSLFHSFKTKVKP